MPNPFIDLGRATLSFIGMVATPVIAPVGAALALVHVRSLRSAYKKNFIGIPKHVADQLQPFYDIKLAEVKYAEFAIVPGLSSDFGAITFGNTIFFTGGINYTKREDVRLLIHELEHCRQYDAHGGLYPFLVKYIAQSTLRGTFNVHKYVGLEREATAKEKITDDVFPFGKQYTPAIHQNFVMFSSMVAKSDSVQ